MGYSFSHIISFIREAIEFDLRRKRPSQYPTVRQKNGRTLIMGRKRLSWVKEENSHIGGGERTRFIVDVRRDRRFKFCR